MSHYFIHIINYNTTNVADNFNFPLIMKKKNKNVKWLKWFILILLHPISYLQE